MKRRMSTLLLLALGAAACGGPGATVSFGGKAVPINVAFGKPELKLPKGTPTPVLQPGPGGIGVVPVVPGFSGFGGGPAAPPVSLAPTREPTSAPAPTVSCPAQDPFAFPRAEATNLVRTQVPEGTFPYRVTGSFTVNGKKSSYATVLMQKVTRQPADAAGRQRFSTAFTLLDVPFTVTYAVVPPVEGTGQAAAGEIGLESTVRDSTDGSGASFRPVEPLRLLQLRAEKGASWTEASSDPLSATSATVDGEITDKVRVNACGRPVEAWKSVVTMQTVSAGQDIVATRTLFFATGLGGLPVAEQVSYSGTADGDRVSGESSMTINVDPSQA